MKCFAAGGFPEPLARAFARVCCQVLERGLPPVAARCNYPSGVEVLGSDSADQVSVYLRAIAGSGGDGFVTRETLSLTTLMKGTSIMKAMVAFKGSGGGGAGG